MHIDEYLRLRPKLYHLTAASNLAHIEREGLLHPASDLLSHAGRLDLLHTRRRANVSIDAGGLQRIIRDQAPLYEGNFDLQGGMTYGEFIAYVNRHVFFWPGTDEGPIEYGRRHFTRYASEECVVLVVDGRALLEHNRQSPPLFSRFNSGSPRCSGGRKSPRGPDTFVPAANFVTTPSGVIETVFASSIALPKGAWSVRSHREFPVRAKRG